MIKIDYCDCFNRPRNIVCKSECPPKEICHNVEVDAEECQVTPVRICDSLPPEKCQPIKVKMVVELKT